MKADPSPTRSRVETAIGIDLGDKRIEDRSDLTQSRHAGPWLAPRVAGGPVMAVSRVRWPWQFGQRGASSPNTRAINAGHRYVEEPVWCLVVGDRWQCSSSGSTAGDRGTMGWRVNQSKVTAWVACGSV